MSYDPNYYKANKEKYKEAMRKYKQSREYHEKRMEYHRKKLHESIQREKEERLLGEYLTRGYIIVPTEGGF